MVTALPAPVVAHVAAIDDHLSTFLATSGEDLLALTPDLAPALEVLTTFLEGGKRLRGALLLLGHELAGGTADRVLGPAVACELLQACALLHDDWIDAAPTRRGRPAAHVTFADRHRSLAWSGDADHYGAAMAVLLGDLAFALGDRAFLDADLPPGDLLAGMAHYTLLREEVMAGQTLDVEAAAARTTDPDVTLDIARLKSGRYSVTRPLQTGAVLAGADADLVARLLDVGEPLGLAFQLRDDLLGVFGSEEATGKPASGDLFEGKRTFLVTTAAAALPATDRDRLFDRLGADDLDEAGADELRDLLRRSGAVDATQERITGEVTRARAALDDLAGRVDAAALEALRAMSGWFTDRQA